MVAIFQYIVYNNLAFLSSQNNQYTKTYMYNKNYNSNNNNYTESFNLIYDRNSKNILGET